MKPRIYFERGYWRCDIMPRYNNPNSNARVRSLWMKAHTYLNESNYRLQMKRYKKLDNAKR